MRHLAAHAAGYSEAADDGEDDEGGFRSQQYPEAGPEVFFVARVGRRVKYLRHRFATVNGQQELQCVGVNSSSQCFNVRVEKRCHEQHVARRAPYATVLQQMARARARRFERVFASENILYGQIARFEPVDRAELDSTSANVLPNPSVISENASWALPSLIRPGPVMAK